MELTCVVSAAVMSAVVMTGLDRGPCPRSPCISQHEDNLIVFLALPPSDNSQQIEHLLEARDPAVRGLKCELLPFSICPNKIYFYGAYVWGKIIHWGNHS